MTEEYAASRYEEACALLPGQLRAAAMLGHVIRPIAVSELPAALIGTENPFDPENSRPFGAEVLQ